jgi:hypothetical protein
MYINVIMIKEIEKIIEINNNAMSYVPLYLDLIEVRLRQHELRGLQKEAGSARIRDFHDELAPFPRPGGRFCLREQAYKDMHFQIYLSPRSSAKLEIV